MGAASLEDVEAFLGQYVVGLELMVGEASDEDFYGSEGWQHRMGWD